MDNILENNDVSEDLRRKFEVRKLVFERPVNMRRIFIFFVMVNDVLSCFLSYMDHPPTDWRMRVTSHQLYLEMDIHKCTLWEMYV